MQAGLTAAMRLSAKLCQDIAGARNFCCPASCVIQLRICRCTWDALTAWLHDVQLVYFCRSARVIMSEARQLNASRLVAMSTITAAGSHT